MPEPTPGFVGRRRRGDDRLPPGQYETRDFPVLSAGPTPRVDPARWDFTITSVAGNDHTWDWQRLHALPAETTTVDLHCVTSWSKLGTTWTGWPLDLLLDEVDIDGPQALVYCDGGYTTNLPVDDLRGGRAWLVDRYDGASLVPAHGGPVRLLVPHLYLWKSAKWVRGIRLLPDEQLGFWERVGYHAYGDPWREQRYAGD